MTRRALPPWITPMQAVAWIMTRDEAVVLRADLHWQIRSADIAETMEDSVVWADDKPGLLLFYLDLCCAERGVNWVGGDDLKMSENARRLLVEELRLGRVVATARYIPQSGVVTRSVEISAADWAAVLLDVDASLKDTDQRALVAHKRDECLCAEIVDTSWEAIKIRTTDVQQLWPGPPPASSPSPIAVKRHRGRPPKYNWQPILDMIRSDLDENGVPADGDGGQTRLEKLAKGWLHPDGETPSESTIRLYIAREIKEARKKRG